MAPFVTTAPMGCLPFPVFMTPLPHCASWNQFTNSLAPKSLTQVQPLWKPNPGDCSYLGAKYLDENNYNNSY